MVVILQFLNYLNNLFFYEKIDVSYIKTLYLCNANNKNLIKES